MTDKRRYAVTPDKVQRVGYVLKKYPRLSETFIVNEILAHESSGMCIEIFSLRHSSEELIHDMVKRVKAPINHLYKDEIGITRFWNLVKECADLFPTLWSALDATRYDNAKLTYQAMLLAKSIKEKDITHLHAHFASSAVNVARLASKITGIPFSVTAHAKDIYSNNIDKTALRQSLNDASAIVTVSDYNIDYIDKHLGGVGTDIKRIYNGLPLEQFIFQSPEERPDTIVAIGRLVEKKGFEVLVKACKLIQGTRKDFKCLIIGDGHLKQELLQLVTSLDLTAHIELCGPKSQAEIKRHIQQAAVLAAPCLVSNDGDRDGLPTVLIESMALGTPCVSTDVTGIPEIVIDNKTGLLVPQHDAQLLATAIRHLLDSASSRVQLATHARQLVETHFDISRNSQTMRSFILDNTESTLNSNTYARTPVQVSR
ncbi:MAG: glycosyltransferase family 4 protein [Pseudomonadota bacterium]